MILATPALSEEFALGVDPVGGRLENLQAIRLGIVLVVAKDARLDPFAGQGESHLHDPFPIACNPMAQIGHVFYREDELVMIGVGLVLKTFGRSFHQDSFVTGSPFAGKTLFLFPVNDPILSTANPRVKEIVKLRQSSQNDENWASSWLRGQTRSSNSWLPAGNPAKSTFAGNLPRRPEQKASSRLREQGRELVELGPDAFAKSSYKRNSEGILALAETWDLGLSWLPAKPRISLVLDEVEKPGNLGAILRTADAFGVSSVLLSEPELDFFNPNMVRSSRGLMAATKIGVGDKQEVFSWLDEEGLCLVGTSARAKKSYWDCEFKDGTAFVLGSEKLGLGPFWRERVQEWVRIPMEGRASSLNLNVSAACLMAEFNRTVSSTLQAP